jgi:hypothetical protein
MKKVNTILIVGILLITTYTAIISPINARVTMTDFDPLVDIEVTVETQIIRFLEVDASDVSYRSKVFEKLGILNPFINSVLGKTVNPSFYLKIYIDNVEFESDKWPDSKYIYDKWTATLNVPDDEELVDIKIQLWTSIGDLSEDKLCDISGDNDGSDDSFDVELVYSIKTGHWTGDDKLSDDPSGYGRLCGTDDGTIYEKNRDSEIWFNIYQNDYDGDNIPYWTEVNDYGSDPEVNNLGEDSDSDGLPIEWEWKWGYDPFVWNNHQELDPDGDSIDNYEEFLVSEWLSDPFRKDVYVELDLMEEGPNGEKSYFPINSEELINTAFNVQNIVFHLDYGSMGGHELIPFDDLVESGELRRIYNDYFLHGDNNNWRRGIFHYGVVLYKSVSAAGYMFRPNAFQISSDGHEIVSENPWAIRDVVYASAYMHELGHTFNFWPIPGHQRISGIKGTIYWLICRSYYSCMNYGWIYHMVDYSDGSRRWPDIDDWNRIDYHFFEKDGW